MKKLIYIFGLVLVATTASCQSNEDTKHDEIISEDKQPFSVMSFNIRHHDDNDPQPLEVRKTYILNIITENAPDIVGLQEFSNNWFEDWMTGQMTTLGYGYYMDETAGGGSPKVIFFKSDRFSLQGQATYHMNYTENRTGTWVLLHDSINNQDYFVANSHWTTVSSAERVLTAQEVLSIIQTKYNGLPVISFGDFNAQPNTPEINLLKNSEAPVLMSSVDESQKTFHGWDAVGNSKIDWIFHSPEFNVEESEVIRTSYNNNWPSDHWPVIATFSINN